MLDALPFVRACLECGTEFEPGKTRRRYCGRKCRKKSENGRVGTVTDRVISVKGRICSNCRSDAKGPRYAFWWDNWDRQVVNLEMAMVLCYPCDFRFNRVKSMQEARIQRYEAEAEGDDAISLILQ